MANNDFIDVQKHLAGVDYPASRDDLVAAARSNGAPGELVERIASLPDEQYEAPTDVTKALSG